MFDSAFLAKLERLHLLSRRTFGGQSRAERRSHKLGSSLEFADYRNYVPGDDLRSIDWNIYGRSDKLFLKLFEEEEDLHIYLLVDVSDSMRWQARDERNDNAACAHPSSTSRASLPGRSPTSAWPTWTASTSTFFPGNLATTSGLGSRQEPFPPRIGVPRPPARATRDKPIWPAA